MAKRFVDNCMFDNPWFQSLEPPFKCLWFYILMKCDNAGVWKANLPLAGYSIGHNFDEKPTLKTLNSDRERIKTLDNGGKWWVVDFVKFQYGVLSENCKPHIHVINLLNSHGLSKGYSKGIQRVSGTLEDKDKSKDKDILGGCKGGKKKFIPPTLGEVKEYVAKNPKLSNVDVVDFWEGFNDGDWIDTKGNPVRNWKMKLRTWSKHSPAKQEDESDSFGTPPDIMAEIVRKENEEIRVLATKIMGDEQVNREELHPMLVERAEKLVKKWQGIDDENE